MCTRSAATELTCLACCRLQEALADFEQALTIEPKNALSHNARGLLLEKMGKPDAALADFEAAVQLEGGTNVDFLRNRGLCFRARRDYNKAVEDFDRSASPQSQDMSHAPHARQFCCVCASLRGGIVHAVEPAFQTRREAPDGHANTKPGCCSK